LVPASYPQLLSPGRIGSLELRNRVLLTPMGTNLEADDGTPGERIIRFYEARARGGVGMVIVGVTGVAWPAGVSNPHNMGLSRDEFIPAFRELTERVHAHGARVAIQLQHAGRTALQDVLAGRPLWVPSVVPDTAGDLFDTLTPEETARVTEPYRAPGAKLAYREMTAEDAAQLCGWFAEAAKRARHAGFDGAEIHAGHGYVLSSFLSPSTNRREDEYGGPLENRARLLLEVIRAVRARVGDDFPLWCRLDGVEYRKKNGIRVEDAQRTAELAVAAGLDAIHVSAYADPRSGIAFTDAPLPHEPCAYAGLAAGMKRRLHVPVIAVGRIGPLDGERILREGGADFIAMGRKLVADPELVNKLATSDAVTIRPCIYSYRCVGNVFLRRASTCTVNPGAGREAADELAPAADPKRILVAGGGPAGLEAARRLALRGHEVVLWEASDRLGGLALAAAAAEPNNGPLLEHLVDALQRLEIGIRTAWAVTPDRVAELEPEVVVVAVGARLVRPELPGADGPRVFDLSVLRDGLEGLVGHGPRIAVIGGDSIGLEVAEALSGRGCEVEVLESGVHTGLAMSPPRRWRAHHLLAERGVLLHTGVSLRGIDETGVAYADAEGIARVAPANAVLLATGLGEDPDLAEALAPLDVDVHRIGDCRGLGYIEGALRDAAELARAL
jgi:2,4-dienoyl-CoA reductase-like NADH-dependent reductase (Old Yellow Enzyme family)/thioredoxin reductase